MALTGIGKGGEPGQAVTITATNDNPALVPNPSIAYFSSTSTGTLRLQPAPDTFGSCLITVTASDGQPQKSTVVRTFRVTVSPVNDDQAQNGNITRSFRVTVPAVPVISGSRGSTGNTAVTLYPNPAPGGRFILAGAAPGPLDVTVLDLSGRIVLQQQLVAGPQPLLLALPPTAAAGVYVVRVRSAGSMVVRRLAVE